MLDSLPPVLAELLAFASTRLAEAEALARAEATRAPLLLLLGASALAVWLLQRLAAVGPAKRRARAAEARAAEARAQAETLGLSLARAEAEAARAPGLEEMLAEERDAGAAARAEAAALEAQLQAERREASARLEEVRRMGEEVERKFAGLAQTALDGAQGRFLGLVSERFRTHQETADAELAKRQAAIEALVRPVGDSLAKFEARVGDIEKAREGAYAAVQEQVKALGEGQARLRDETARLVQALRAPKTRGAWGELQLRRVFELAGMSEHVDYATEVSMETADGRRRPDAVVRLPGGRTLVIDAKTPLDAYLAALEAPDDAKREAELVRHARQLRDRVKELSAKEYWRLLDDAPDFVVMFVPGEAFYSVAMERDPRLFEDAMEARVVIASPTTLVALAKSVAYGWRQEALARDAREIASAARELYDRLGVFGGHLDKVGRALDRASRSFNDAIGSMETRVLPVARRFETLKVPEAGAEMTAPARIEVEPRLPAAAELRPALPAAE